MSAPKPLPVCRTFVKWVEGRLEDKGCFAPCTGQDFAALKAFAHLLEVWARADEGGREATMQAMTALVLQGMQETVRPLAKAMIPHVLDWSHEGWLWGEITARMAGQTRRGSL